MSVPAHMLPHTVTRIRPSTTTQYGNALPNYTVPPATSTTMAAWMQQDEREEEFAEGRDPLDQLWLMVTNDSDVLGLDRITWDGRTFEVTGPPAPVYTPAGYHHTESTLRIVQG
jgi:hypothetical protein